MTGRISFSWGAFTRPGLLLSLFLSSGLLVVASQTPSPEAEVKAGAQAIQRGNYAEATTHFTQANALQQGKCSECYVWLARIALAGGKLPDALDYAEKAAATAATSAERSRAQLYRGVIFGRQGDLAQAEAAFKSAVSADAACAECKFNLGFVLLKESKDAEGVEVLKAVVPEFAGTPRGHEIEKFIADPSLIRKDLAPQFSARASNGKEINLDTLKGKVVLLDFWGTWCAPCRVSLPLLKDLASKVDPAKVAIVSIDEGDSKEKWERFIRENGMTWTQVYDGDLALHHAFRVDGYPRYYILSKDGVIVNEFKGWKQDGEATIANAINQALAQ